jgi:RimJ/RimL family protein N-acetyltransferase
MPFPLSTPRLLIRPFRDSDLEPFLAYRNDPLVAEYQGWDVPYARERALDFVNEMKTKQFVAGEWLQLAVEHRESPLSPRERTEGSPTRGGEGLIGDLALHPMQSDLRQAFLGYTFARAHWGHGYATEAVQRLLDYMFRDLGLHRVVAECDVLNNASYRLLERLGFRREAHFIENAWFKGRWSSEYHYALLQKEWLLR